MSQTTETCGKRNRMPYIEPTIRTIVGALCTGLAVAQFLYPEYTLYWQGTLLFIGINLFQSGFTRWCMMEKLLRALGFRCEIEEIRHLTEQLAESNARLNSYMRTLDLVNEAILELDTEGRILSASEGWRRMLAQVGVTVSCSTLTCCIVPEDLESVLTVLKEIQTRQGETRTVRFRLLCGTKRIARWMEAKFMADHIEGQWRIRAILHDVTEAHLRECQIQHMALHDSLTGLPNRHLLQERMSQLLEQRKNSTKPVGLLFIDLDNFKQVNDRHGHSRGDLLLRHVAEALDRECREWETPGRWGGDEFLVLLELPDEEPRHHLLARAEALMKSAASALREAGMDSIVTLSIGGAIFPEDAESIEDLLLQADTALYEAKERGKNNIRIRSLVETGAGAEAPSGKLTDQPASRAGSA